MQTRIRHHPHRLTKANNQHLLGFTHGEQRTVSDDDDREQHQQRDNT